jgi:hypothetical protein
MILKRQEHKFRAASAKHRAVAAYFQPRMANREGYPAHNEAIVQKASPVHRGRAAHCEDERNEHDPRLGGEGQPPDESEDQDLDIGAHDDGVGCLLATAQQRLHRCDQRRPGKLGIADQQKLKPICISLRHESGEYPMRDLHLSQQLAEWRVLRRF